MNLFEIAVRNKYTFPSTKGELSAQQLLDLPLTSRSGFDLDTVAKTINAELKQTGEESFVEQASPQKGTLENKLELIKLIIRERLQENADKVARLKRAQEIETLENLLDRKQAEALMALSPEEIKARLDSLRNS